MSDSPIWTSTRWFWALYVYCYASSLGLRFNAIENVFMCYWPPSFPSRSTLIGYELPQDGRVMAFSRLFLNIEDRCLFDENIYRLLRVVWYNRLSALKPYPTSAGWESMYDGGLFGSGELEAHHCCPWFRFITFVKMEGGFIVKRCLVFTLMLVFPFLLVMYLFLYSITRLFVILVLCWL